MLLSSLFVSRLLLIRCCCGGWIAAFVVAVAVVAVIAVVAVLAVVSAVVMILMVVVVVAMVTSCYMHKH